MGQTLKRKPEPASEPFVQLRPRDNFYQSVSFFPMPFALITTVNERGTTSIGPYSLVFPFGISESHSMMLISRASSNTATNLRRTGKCALNFIEFDRDWLKSVVDLGYPGQVPEDKDGRLPVRTGKIAAPGAQQETRLPIDAEFWFAKHSQPFFFPVPRDKGNSHRQIYYMANKVDPDIRFSKDACMELTGVPKVFLDVVLDGLLAEARAESVRMIDKQFVKAVEARRAAQN